MVDHRTLGERMCRPPVVVADSKEGPQEGVREVANDRRAQPVLITDAPESPERELRRREIRYVAMMVTRALCLIAGAVLISTKPPLWGLWLTLCIAGMVLLPWLAVILANDRPAKKRSERVRPRPEPGQTALAAPQEPRVIDADES